MRFDRFYCPKCRKFLKRRQVVFVEHFIPHYLCHWCRTEVIETKAVLERLVEEKLLKENVDEEI